MEIDPRNLPSEVHLLQQIVLQLLQAVEDKDQLLARVQHQLAQLLRYRYGQKRERIDENQLFLFAAQIIAASQRASNAPSSEQPAADSSSRADSKEKKKNQGAAGTAAKRCRNHWSVAGWCLTWKNRNANAGSAKRPCTRSGKMSASDWSLFRLPCKSLKKFAPSTPVRKGVVGRQPRNRRRPLRRGCQGRACWRTWRSANMEIIFR